MWFSSTTRPSGTRKNVFPKVCEQQRLQLAAYSLAINHLYGEQFPAPVTRTSLLFAHPEDSKPVNVVPTTGNLHVEYQNRWIDIFGKWYEMHGDQAAYEQTNKLKPNTKQN